ncbi:MAG TPA: TonB-dependent receptor plug domain-containing protein, partial [Sphingomonadaceae bacterium]|nr:TonB-dependent receptor plug domain-containing protein [Sphingomonadaceae bacterium]
MKTSRALLLSGIACAAILGSSPAVADEQPELADDLDPELVNEDEEILVLADRLRGQVDAPQPPVLVLNEEDIAAYGVGSIADLVQELSPQTNSGRGRGGGFPVMLVNGMRISSFRELRSYPPEALRRVEVLPEEVALRYGYSADQRVINFILKDDFSSTESEREYGQPWAGGYWTSESELTYLRIDGSRRLNLNGEVTLSSALYDVERGIVEPESLIPTIASDPDPATQRTLRDKSWEYAFDGTYTIPVGDSGGSLAFNG